MAGVEVRVGVGLGDRVRALRRAAGMSQSGLAAGRFTKQYVSQIERGVTWPSGDALDWVAERLGVEREFLETGVHPGERDRLASELDAAEQLLAEHRYDEALAAFGDLRWEEGASGVAHRVGCGRVWALLRLGRLDEADALLGRSDTWGASSDLAQAEVSYLSAVALYTRSEMTAALDRFARALALLDTSAEPSDRLRADILQWRSRCYRRLRDLEAAREDVDAALELCESLGEPRRSAEVYLQASLVAEREGRWVLARRHGETSVQLFREVGDELTVGRVLNNLAIYNALLGTEETAVAQLREAFAIFVEAGLEAEAGYVVGSLAEIQRKRGHLDQAESAARRALQLLDGRVDHIQEVGTAQLVLALVHLDQHELDEAEEILSDAETSYAATQSVSHQARAWIARGDLASRRDDAVEAARLYRQAAIALQPLDA